jgi:hypothetical protein
MEQKIIKLMEKKRLVDMCALLRQISIRDGRYTDAMTNQFLFHMHLDEYLTIKKKLSDKDMMAIIKAMICIDYK